MALAAYSNPKKINTENLSKYLKNKRIELGEVEYKKWLQKKTANVTAQIAVRKERGLMPDKKLEDVLRVLEPDS